MDWLIHPFIQDFMSIDQASFKCSEPCRYIWLLWNFHSGGGDGIKEYPKSYKTVSGGYWCYRDGDGPEVVKEADGRILIRLGSGWGLREGVCAVSTQWRTSQAPGAATGKAHRQDGDGQAWAAKDMEARAAGRKESDLVRAAPSEASSATLRSSDFILKRRGIRCEIVRMEWL